MMYYVKGGMVWYGYSAETRAFGCLRIGGNQGRGLIRLQDNQGYEAVHRAVGVNALHNFKTA